MLQAEDKSALLIGPATHGHHQIELACSSCHSDAFGGTEVLQNACLDCHADELQTAHDSHPRKKFTDPRNADLLNIIDARYCTSCHTEHQQEQTHPMGLTVPTDYCFHCHQDISSERDSHQDLAFDSCASSGCHNYHDNRALYEEFLVANAEGHWLAAVAQLADANRAQRQAPAAAATTLDSARMAEHPDISDDWLASRHGAAGVSCSGCHNSEAGNGKDNDGESTVWLEKPGVEQCRNCHQPESEGFLSGKHGMRLAVDLPPMTPGQARLPFHTEAENHELSCNSCHQAHTFDVRAAAAPACLSCHADEHSRNYPDSPHGQLFKQAQQGELPWSQAVTCASCHMPRLQVARPGDPLPSVTDMPMAEHPLIGVEHNQNATLRPNEKMIRPVCMNCHSLSFSIDALADEQLIKTNFNGQPASHIPSLDWSLERVQSR